MTSNDLPEHVRRAINLDLRAGRLCGQFHERQISYLEFHRHEVFGKRYGDDATARNDLMKAIAG